VVKISAMKWDLQHLHLLELVSAWKKQADIAERRVHELLNQQDAMAAEIERLQEELLPRRK
jgi:hypothetical protein